MTVYTHVYTHVDTHVYTHVDTHVYNLVCLHVYAHVYAYLYTHLYTHLYRNVYTLACTHVYTHVHTACQHTGSRRPYRISSRASHRSNAGLRAGVDHLRHYVYLGPIWSWPVVTARRCRPSASL